MNAMYMYIRIPKKGNNSRTPESNLTNYMSCTSTLRRNIVGIKFRLDDFKDGLSLKIKYLYIPLYSIATKYL